MKPVQNNNQNRVRINHQIRIPQVRVILNDGTSPGIMPTQEALKLAQEQGLDLIEINPKGTPPVCKITDFGKLKYEEKKKQAEARKNQKNQELKELSFRPNTDEHDLNHKIEQAKQFLADGNKVKFVVRFRGREIAHPQIGRDKINSIIEKLTGLIVPSPLVSMEGKLMSVLLTPSKN